MLSLSEMAALSALYAQSHRHYHTIAHVQSCLAEFEQYRESPECPLGDEQDINRVESALWYHDAVYNPYSKRNEIESAELYRQEHKLTTPHTSIVFVSSAIEATAFHTKAQQVRPVCLEGLTPNSEATQSYKHIVEAVLDIDLSVLGKSWDEYVKNVAHIQQEYYHTREEDYWAGRLAFLKSMLNRYETSGSLYYVPYFRDLYEEQAVRNIKADIRRLAHRLASRSESTSG